MVERVGGGDGADQDEHDEAHALLAVVGAVEVADAAAGADEQQTDVERRRRGAFGGFVEAGIAGEQLEEQEEQGGHGKADDGREKQGLEDLGDLLPLDAGGAGVALHELVGDADADDGADHGVRAGGGKAAPPGGEVPEDGGDQQREDHGEAGALADLEDELDRQQGDDGEGDGAGAEQHADEVHDAGVDDGDVGLERVGVDAGGDGVGGVVEAVDELEAEGDEQGDAEQNVGIDRGLMDDGEVVRERLGDVEEAADEHDGEEDHAPFAGAGLRELLIEQRACGVYCRCCCGSCHRFERLEVQSLGS